MSDAPGPLEPRPEPRGVHEAIVHAVVVATAFVLGQLLVFPFVVLAARQFYWAQVFGLVRWCALMGIAAAIAAHRAPGRSRPRAAFECVVLAMIAWNVNEVLLLGSEMSVELTGVGLRRTTLMDASYALHYYAYTLSLPGTYLAIAGLALGLYLASSRRGTRWEGLALRGPIAVAAFGAWYSFDPVPIWGLLMLFVPVPIVAIALPLLSRAAERLRSRLAENG